MIYGDLTPIKYIISTTKSTILVHRIRNILTKSNKRSVLYNKPPSLCFSVSDVPRGGKEFFF